MGAQLKAEASEMLGEVSQQKSYLSGMVSLDGNSVKGFDSQASDTTSMVGDSAMDVNTLEDTFEQLDIYAKFLGQDEYLKMRENFTKALSVMQQLHEIEIMRLNNQQPISYEQLIKMYG